MTFQRAAAAATVVFAATAIAASGNGQNPPAQAPPPIALSELKLPAGFKIDVFAEGVTSARQLAFGAKGTVFVGSRTARNVCAPISPEGRP